jgi:myo-inositol-1(or 4)-monophosphatase
LLEASDHLADLELITELARESGEIAMKYFGKSPEVWMKEGESPVSEADYAIDAFLKEKLLKARPNYGWLSEETDDNLDRMGHERTFVVDPIDGTRGFIHGMKRWCISIAIVEDNRPTAGVLECPVMKQTITASAGQGAQLNGKTIRSKILTPSDNLKIAGPRSIGQEFAELFDQDVTIVPFVPSLAYRLAMISMQEIDLSLARGSAKDWDLAAADLIVQEAGAKLTSLDGAQLSYNCHDIRHGTLVASNGNRHDEMLDIARNAIDKHQN